MACLMKRLWLLSAILFAACGGGPAAPSGGAPPTPTPPPGTVLTVVSGETGQPIASATVRVDSGAYTTGTDGRVVLANPPRTRSALDIMAPGMLDRVTLFRSQTDTRFSLWPRSSPTGLDEEFTQYVVYTPGTEGAAGETTLRRIARGITSVVVLPGLALQADSAAMAWHNEAVARMNAAQDGIRYSLATQRTPLSTTTLVVETLEDANDARCAGRVRATTHLGMNNDEIAVAAIVFCQPDAARSITVAHELGHTFGLRHSLSTADLMYSTFSASRSTTFSAREALVMRLMTERRGGNRFPDDDRQVSGTSASRTEVIVCR